MGQVIGFTGAFGSGATSAAKFSRDERGFAYLGLSQIIRDEVKNRGNATATRTDLQALGDELREKYGNDVLAKRSIDQLKPVPDRLAVDGIRNTKEIDYLKERFGYGFTLVAVSAGTKDRWDRVRTVYTDAGLKQLNFHQDDLRDQNEDFSHGQQVQLCVAAADVFIDNSGTIAEFQEKVLETVDLITGDVRRPPRPSEVLMHMAFSASHTSQCLKRHVGAVLADDRGQLISTGYNENPLGTQPCAHEPQYEKRCFRDIVRNAHFLNLSKQNARCATCGEVLPEIKGPPWNCPTCLAKGRKTNLETIYFPDKAMNWCTAVHAEVWAILAAGGRARGATLYTTTFPCLQCVEKITQAGVGQIIYTEAYTDPYSENRLRIAGVDFRRFEGVRSSSFERLFPRPS